ncbi:MAG: multifunctional oxoglutarate decarboxylase/oxoglutarate dehydrogenase thiamine pyrophosphate-binding subunit/dihydrolipoyllysine-residue succinyltransferase subunit, partial [Acidobacteriota bacterium]|nr:multifunctional oxoglutarate decarboxylase/oxoglutarate dehydrogenase thiamine pyrophosphate-binding subunit/dihydrolipoyllysine-residue succinyltransferase subunit [Acidobacteriota bacterium]
PLGYQPQPNSELELATYGLGVWDLDRQFLAGTLNTDGRPMKLRDILETLQRTYCRRIGVEYMHIADPDLRHWLQRRLEDGANEVPLPRETKIRIMKKLNAAEAFETFLHTNYVGQKRFSLEGAETLIPVLDTLMAGAVGVGVEQVVVGMAHRGRLNVLANLVGKSYRQVFKEFEGTDPDSALGSGDVKYHLGACGKFEEPEVGSLDIVVSSNPSHLEAVNPVVEGMTRARQDRIGDQERNRVLPVLIHGDAAFSGQGVVAETLHLSKLRGYRTGGTIHIVVNNQIGFTTGPQDQKSSLYPTDVAKMVGAPIFHVNGDHPEQAVRVIRHALAFRHEFQRDVVVNMVCYRRWGHNEGDEPSYTHPRLYGKIKTHRSVRKLYTEMLLRSGDFDPETTEKALEDFRKRLREVHDEVLGSPDDDSPVADCPVAEERREIAEVDLRESLEKSLDALSRVPADFDLHPKLERQLQQRRQRYENGTIDWGQAESLAFGSLVLQGINVRLSGEDCGRGTFSQRHAILYDHSTSRPYSPLSHISPDQATFQVFDSLLSEFAVLGFEYGYSVDRPNALVMWEAQFGDFANGAQVVIDQFVSSAHDKWGQESAVTLLLPHGYEGQGPEHSSARLERFLQLAADRNIRVAYPSTPAQYFHLLRRQAHDTERRPLVVMTPKSLLRLPACVSTADDLVSGEFQPLLRPDVDPAGVHRAILCSGKVYYDLTSDPDRLDGIAVGRLEQFFPLDIDGIRDWLLSFPAATDWIWVQEEPRNMGAWSFLREALDTELADAGIRLRYVGRAASASTATGSNRRHTREQERLVDDALKLAVERSL